MNFKQFVLGQASQKHRDMYDDVSKNPVNIETKLCDYSVYDKKRLDYNNRLSQERRDYNNALDSVISVRDARIKKEKDIAWQIAERKKARAFAVKQIISTIALLLPTIILLLGGIIVIVNPIPVFKLINFWIIICVYLIALISIIIAATHIIKNYEYKDSLIMHNGKTKAIMLMVCGFFATAVMAFGMINVGNITVELSSADDFILMKNLPVAGRCHFQLQNDIDCGGSLPNGWGSIGTFTGEFDGNYHSIKNIKYKVSNSDKTDQSIGMVNSNEGIIKNLSIEDSVFEHKISCNDDSKNDVEFYFGVIAAEQNYNYTTRGTVMIDNCRMLNVSVKVEIETNGEKGGSTTAYVGGFVGINRDGSITNCEYYNDEQHTMSGSIHSSNRDVFMNMGGVAGYDFGDIQDCIVYNVILNGTSANSSDNAISVGGLVGWAESRQEYSNCVSYAICSAVATDEHEGYWTGQDADAYQGVMLGELDGDEFTFNNCLVILTNADDRAFGWSNNMWVDSLPNDHAGVTCILKDESENVLKQGYNGWSYCNRGYATPCEGFDN